MFFDVCGIILKHWIPRGQTANAVQYIEMLKQLGWAIAAKRPELWKVNNWLLHRDNVPAYCSVKTLKFLAYHQTTFLEQPAYSPVIWLRMIFSCTRRSNKCWEGLILQAKESWKRLVKEYWHTLWKCFNSWKIWMEKCVKAGWEYIEGCKY